MSQLSSLRNSNMNWLMIPTLLYIVCKIDCQTVTITKDPTTAVTVGANVTLKCTYDGLVPETGVKWFNGSDTTGHAYTSSCVSIPGLAAFYNTTRISASCNSTGNVYNLTITTALNDNDTLWCCSYQFSGGASPISCNSSVQISFKATQTNFDDNTLMDDLDRGKEGLTENEKIGIGAGCGGGGVIIIICIAGVIYRKKINSSTASNTLVHHNSSNGEHQLQQQSVNKPNNQMTDSLDKHLYLK